MAESRMRHVPPFSFAKGAVDERPGTCVRLGMATSRRTTDPLRIAAAQITGTLSRCVVGGQVSEDRALVEFGASLAAVPDVRWEAVLNEVAAAYVDKDGDVERRALDLLQRAGVDLERA